MKVKVVNLTGLHLISVVKIKNTVIVASIVLVALVFSLFAKIYRGDAETAEVYAEVEKIIIIDAGHGGTDDGEKMGGITEADVTLESARLLKEVKDAGIYPYFHVLEGLLARHNKVASSQR